MTNRHMERCSFSLVTKEVPFEIKIKYQVLVSKTGKDKKTERVNGHFWCESSELSILLTDCMGEQSI